MRVYSVLYVQCTRSIRGVYAACRRRVRARTHARSRRSGLRRLLDGRRRVEVLVHEREAAELLLQAQRQKSTLHC